MRALVVEHEIAAARDLSLLLKSAGGVVDQVDSGEEALELARHYDYDIVLLELLLPDIEGYEVVRRMRGAHIETPVVILSGLSRPQAKVKAFALGTDDFITKPFDHAELLARIQAVIRRSKGFSQAALQVGPLTLNLDRQEVIVGGRTVHLTSKEYAILGVAGIAQGYGVDQRSIPEPPLWWHGRA